MRRAFVRLVGLSAALAAAGAVAYVLPGWSIVRRMTSTRDELGVSSLRVDGSVSFLGSVAHDAALALGLPADRPEVQLDAAVLLKLPDRCRFELLPPEGGAKAAAVLSDGKARREGREVPAVGVALEQICAVLATRSSRGEGDAREAVLGYLKEKRIDLGASSLARQGGQVAYVIGNPAEGKPQLWVYKDTFLPARLKVLDGGVLWDVRFIDYGSPVTGDAFPRMVEVYKGGELALRFTALKSDSKATLADKLF